MVVMLPAGQALLFVLTFGVAECKRIHHSERVKLFSKFASFGDTSKAADVSGDFRSLPETVPAPPAPAPSPEDSGSLLELVSAPSPSGTGETQQPVPETTPEPESPETEVPDDGYHSLPDSDGEGDKVDGDKGDGKESYMDWVQQAWDAVIGKETEVPDDGYHSLPDFDGEGDKVDGDNGDGKEVTEVTDDGYTDGYGEGDKGGGKEVSWNYDPSRGLIVVGGVFALTLLCYGGLRMAQGPAA